MKYLFVLILFPLYSIAQVASGERGHNRETLSTLSLAELDASMRLDPQQVIWLNDPGKEGTFVYAGTARDQSEDNGGTLIINESLQKFRRVYNGVIDARWFGVTPNAAVPTTGALVKGTDNTPFLQRAINAADEGETVLVPPGRYLFATPLDTIKGPKRISLLFMGDTYHNGSDFIIITNEGGAYEQHTIKHEGRAIGRINMPRHTKETHDKGTQPQWSDFTGTLVKIYNAYQQLIELNRVDGFRAPIEIIGGRGNGSQENTVRIRSAYKNANGIILTSLDGQSYVDKNEFWVSRMSGGLGIKIDGYAGKARNGEIFNGAARSNKFHVMIEQVDSIAECHGDITEPLFDITVEGGDHTGVFGNVGFRMRSEAPNFVRSPKFTGQGILEARMLQHGAGIGGTINVPVWNSSKGIFFGNYALIDLDGNIVFLRQGFISKAHRDVAPANFRFANFGDAELDVNITSANYEVAPGVRYVYYNHASGKLKLPQAEKYFGRLVTICNDHATGKVEVSNASGSSNVVAPGGAVTYRSDGKRWRAVTNP